MLLRVIQIIAMLLLIGIEAILFDMTMTVSWLIVFMTFPCMILVFIAFLFLLISFVKGLKNKEKAI